MAKSIGIKELKDQASSIIQAVVQTRKPVIITKNDKPVARIEALESSTDFFERMAQLGLVLTPPQISFNDVELRGEPMDPALALQAILEDREDD
jgi:prevent-host-death family protein